MFWGKLFTSWDLPTSYFSNFDDAFLISLELLKNFMVQSNWRVFQHDQNMLIYWALKCMFICSFLKMQDIFNFSAIFKYCLSLTNHLRLYGRNQKQSPEVGFVKKVFLKISPNLQETCARVSYLIKLQALVKSLREPFLQHISRWLLLYFYEILT